jgi:hypothetical protein
MAIPIEFVATPSAPDWKNQSSVSDSGDVAAGLNCFAAAMLVLV